jgi:hypothetical protein
MFGPCDSRPPASTLSRRWNTVGSRACCASAAIAPACSSKEGIGQQHHALGAALAQLCKGGFEFGGHAGIDDLNLEPQRARRIHELSKLDGDADALDRRSRAVVMRFQGNGFNEQMFGAEQQVQGRGQSD